MSFILGLLTCLLLSGSYIDVNKDTWAKYYVDAQPKEISKEWFLPFNNVNRKNPKELQMVSAFGSPRATFLKGHIHTGIDITQKSKRFNRCFCNG